MPRIRISPWLPVGLCILYRLDSVGCFWPFLLAAAVHELGHISVLYLTGARVRALALSLGGTVLETSPLSYHQELLSAAAGPIFGLLLLTVRRSFPWLAFWGVIQSLYNLLPIYPLDGGRILQALLASKLPLHRAEGICRGVSIGLGIIMCGCSLYAVRILGILPVLIASFLFLQILGTVHGSS